MKSWHRGGLLWLLCATGMALVKPAQDRVDSHLKQPSQVVDLLYFGSAESVKMLALGYDSLFADIYWMRAIQYYGRREEAARRAKPYGNLSALLDITTTLDPRLMEAYRFGVVFLGEAEPLGAGQPNEAIRLIDKGIAAYPHEWRLQFDKGFVYFWHLNDYQKAGEVWLAASRIPNAPRWLEGLAAMGLSKSGAIETARTLWQRQYEEADRADVRENALKYIQTMDVNEACWTLEFFVERYQKRFGARPARLQELVSAGLLKIIARDPLGSPYQYDPSTGKVVLSPNSPLGKLKMPYDYRDVFRERLVQLYGPN